MNLFETLPEYSSSLLFPVLRLRSEFGMHFLYLSDFIIQVASDFQLGKLQGIGTRAQGDNGLKLRCVYERDLLNFNLDLVIAI